MFTVTLSVAFNQPVTMSFHSVNGTTTMSNDDYVAKTGTLTFAPGETTKTITVAVKGDSKRESVSRATARGRPASTSTRTCSTLAGTHCSPRAATSAGSGATIECEVEEGSPWGPSRQASPHRPGPGLGERLRRCRQGVHRTCDSLVNNTVSAC